MKNKGLLRILISFFSLMLLFTASSSHAEKDNLLKPLLIELKGWNSDDPQGMSMNMGGMNMITASRNYTKGNKNIDAMVFLGNQAMTQGKMQEMTAESDETSIKISTIDGFKTHFVENKNDNSISLMVFLAQGQAQGAMFIFSSNNLSKNNAISCAKKFDWKKMKAAVQKLF